MPTASEPTSQREATLDRLAEQYVWGRTDTQVTLADQICELLGRQGDEEFDLDAWAIDRVEGLRGNPSLLADGSQFVGRAGPYIGLAVEQWWNNRDELITAIQLHPGERQVLAEGGIEEVEREELVGAMRQEIAAALTRARFLGLDALAVRLLCEEGLAASGAHDYEALRVAAFEAPTLGDGEGIRPVRVVGVELLEGYRVRIAFDDGVTRALDLDPFLRGPGYAAIRRPAFFLQLRIYDGAICWPNRVALDPIALRYFPAIGPEGVET